MNTLEAFRRAFEEVFTKEKIKEIKDIMDNVNPSGKCARCRKECGTGHVICPDCYLILSFNLNE